MREKRGTRCDRERERSEGKGNDISEKETTERTISRIAMAADCLAHSGPFPPSNRAHAHTVPASTSYTVKRDPPVYVGLTASRAHTRFTRAHARAQTHRQSSAGLGPSASVTQAARHGRRRAEEKQTEGRTSAPSSHRDTQTDTLRHRPTWTQTDTSRLRRRQTQTHLDADRRPRPVRPLLLRP